MRRAGRAAALAGGIAGLFALAGCTAAPDRDPPAPAAAGLVLDAGGIAVAGSGLRVDFGRAGEGAVAAVSELLGRPPEARETLTACAGGPVAAVRWARGLTLNFRGGAFLGWVSGPGPGGAPGLPVADGLAAGSPAPAPPALPATAPGAAFETAGIGGIVADGRVARRWAGLACIAP